MKSYQELDQSDQECFDHELLQLLVKIKETHPGTPLTKSAVQLVTMVFSDEFGAVISSSLSSLGTQGKIRTKYPAMGEFEPIYEVVDND